MTDRKTKSPAQDAKNNEKPKMCSPQGGKEFGTKREQRAPSQFEMHEHKTLRSRTTGRDIEVSMGPHGAGLVPKNPFASLAQSGYMHSHPEVLGKTALDEWDAATKGKKLPKHVK